MKRREFITLLGGAAAAWPLAARSQQAGMPVIGFLSVRGPHDDPHLTGAVLQGLKEAGFVEDRNVKIDYRYADSRFDRLAALAADLVRRRVVMIVTLGGNDVAAAAKAATTTIPIVSNFGADPVTYGLVASLSRPGANLTGISRFATDLLPKRVELLRDVVPKAIRIGFLLNPTSGYAVSDVEQVQAAARTLGRQVVAIKASTEREIETAFATLVESRADALLVEPDPFFNSRSRVEHLATLTLRHAVPTMHSLRDFVVAGGLMSYAPSLVEVYHQVGIYVGRVLKGEKPADLPVQQATKIEFVINLKTARSFGLTVPPTLLGFADEVIE
jgi:putative tryptophan/tyrosine transport system substrate-binding protein